MWNNNFCQESCEEGSWPDRSDMINNVSGAQYAVCAACSSLCADGCVIPSSINATALAAVPPSSREALTAAFCTPAGEQGCNPSNAFYSVAPTTIAGFPVNGTCMLGTTANCPVGT